MKNTITNTTATTNNIPVVAAAYASTSEIKVDSALTKETTKKLVTISPIGQFCARLVANYGTPDYNFSRKAIYSFGSLKAADADKLYKFAARFYGEVSRMMDLREKAAGANSELAQAEQAVKVSADGWFLWLGTRKPKNGETKPRGIYGVRYADFAIFGEIAADARKAAGDNVKAIPEKFLEMLCLSAGRIITGKPLGRVSENDLNKARKAWVKERAEKAAATKAENKKTEVKEAAKEAEKERKEASEKSAKVSKIADVANELSESIRESSATEEEKAQMLDLVKALVSAATAK